MECWWNRPQVERDVKCGTNMRPCASEHTVKVIRVRQNAYDVSNCRAFWMRLKLSVSCIRLKLNRLTLKLLPFCSLQVTSRTPFLSILVSFCVIFFAKERKRSCSIGRTRFLGISVAFVPKNILIFSFIILFAPVVLNVRNGFRDH